MSERILDPNTDFLPGDQNTPLVSERVGVPMVRPDWEEFSAQYLFSDPSKNTYVSCLCGETIQTREALCDHWQLGHFDRLKDEVKLSAEEVDRQLDAMIDALPTDDQQTSPVKVAAQATAAWDMQLLVRTSKGRSKLPRVALPPILPSRGTIFAGGKTFKIESILLNFDERCYVVEVYWLDEPSDSFSGLP